MRREIEVQTDLDHPNIMPVLDHSSSYVWYTMPLAIQLVGKLTPPVDHQRLLQIVENCARGLEATHQKGYIHRDLTPNNILLLDDDISGRRWVVADWGLVRRYGKTTIVRTRPEQSFGTMGFAAPELWEDAHTAGEEADVYSLGRVVAWCLTGEWPRPNLPLLPTGVWHDFVHAATILQRSQRLPNMEATLEMLDGLKAPV